MCSRNSSDGSTQLSATDVTGCEVINGYGLPGHTGWLASAQREASDWADRSQRVLVQGQSAKQQREDGYLAMATVICTNR
jgi:hypothetical protein